MKCHHMHVLTPTLWVCPARRRLCDAQYSHACTSSALPLWGSQPPTPPPLFCTFRQLPPRAAQGHLRRFQLRIFGYDTKAPPPSESGDGLRQLLAATASDAEALETFIAAVTFVAADHSLTDPATGHLAYHAVASAGSRPPHACRTLAERPPHACRTPSACMPHACRTVRALAGRRRKSINKGTS